MRSDRIIGCSNELERGRIGQIGNTPGMQNPEGWNEVEGALQRGFRFENFAEAIAFVNRLAELAETEDHHPDIAVSWNAVTIRWRTHVKRAITERDAEMAKRTNELARG
jgi:4a-hydroxytetrahydrobiopterin dehydratase